MDFGQAVALSSIAQASELAKHLLESKICPGCVLRFLKSPSAHFGVPLPSAKAACKSLQQRISVEPTTADSPSVHGRGGYPPATGPQDTHAVCPACLGILQGLEAAESELVDDAIGDATVNGVDSSKGDEVAGTGSGSEDKSDPNGLNPPPASVCPLPPGSLGGERLRPEGAVESGVAGVELGAGADLCSIIQAGIQASGHQLEDFALEVALPPLLLVRQHALWAHLQAALPSLPFLHQRASHAVLPVKDALKAALASRLEQTLGVPCVADSSLRCTLTFTHPDNGAEVEAALGPARQPTAKRHKGKYGQWKNGASVDDGDGGAAAASPAAVQTALDGLASDETRTRLPWPPKEDSLPCNVAVQCWRSPLYVGGRYLKLVRGVSQSPWLVDEERVGKDTSVQELLAAGILPHFKADDHKFSSAGREDIDVRMLGRGRPFVLEILNARRMPTPAEYAAMEEHVNSRPDKLVAVRAVQVVGRAQVDALREGEADKQKEYAAVVWLPRPATQDDIDKLNATHDLVIQQRTPIRVLHRRSPLIRPRTIHSIRAERVAAKPHYLLLHLCTQAGTYVKEFVHGDLGRTQPNVGSLLGCETDILQLDVTNIKMEFP